MAGPLRELYWPTMRPLPLLPRPVDNKRRKTESVEAIHLAQALPEILRRTQTMVLAPACGSLVDQEASLL